jgi:tRNA threonylcarbamoyladenosine biosynthesis protein TsaE
MQQTWTILTEAELEPVVTEVLQQCREAASADGAVVLALHGDLGAGKTTFMQHLARALQVAETVVSPTFVIMKHYALPDTAPFTNLYHLDAYRIDEVDEMKPLGLTKLLTQANVLVAIEWAERIDVLLPRHTLHLTFAFADTKRVITLTT